MNAARAVALAAALALVCAARSAYAGDRRFGFVTEVDAAAVGAAEISGWTTVFAGRDAYYGRLEPRLELVGGLAPNLEGSVAWTASVTSAGDATSNAVETPNDLVFETAALAFKYKLTDEVADPIGVAFSAEGAYAPNRAGAGVEVAIEKQVGRLLLGGMVSGRQHWHELAQDSESDQEADVSVGLGYFVTPSLVAGVEGLCANLVRSGELASSALYAGPALSFSADTFYLVLSGLAQAYAPESPEGSLDLERGEHLRARLVFALRL